MISAYYLQIIILVGINIIMAASLNLVVGYTGQLSIGHAAFMSLGAYVSAIATLQMGLPFIASLLFGAAVAGLFGILIGIPTLRLKGDYLALLPLASAKLWDYLFKLENYRPAVGLIPKETTLLWVIGLPFFLCPAAYFKFRVGRA